MFYCPTDLTTLRTSFGLAVGGWRHLAYSTVREVFDFLCEVWQVTVDLCQTDDMAEIASYHRPSICPLLVRNPLVRHLCRTGSGRVGTQRCRTWVIEQSCGNEKCPTDLTTLRTTFGLAVGGRRSLLSKTVSEVFEVSWLLAAKWLNASPDQPIKDYSLG